VRFVSGAPRRTGEVLKMGYNRIIRPEGTSEEGVDGRSKKDASVIEVSTLEEAVAVALL